VENLDHGKFFDLLYEGEEDVLKLDVLEMVSSVRQTYPFLCRPPSTLVPGGRMFYC